MYSQIQENRVGALYMRLSFIGETICKLDNSLGGEPYEYKTKTLYFLQTKYLMVFISTTLIVILIT